ncbi:uncharacterized protein LOC106093670 [Stomoxys calcitrans]|uniref:F-box domain-containing protein n=1 Tax=Stomoxys calcitrans TaxID=35570 RepID=A0A1I8PIK5_STOCA|nr:uncharacterized protein LOC106093670 [Stomoxys calcitrans]
MANMILPQTPKGEYNYISNDIWFHLTNYIAPKDVQTFAMICKQSADCVKSLHFWRQLYRKYCLTSSKLPKHLQAHQIANCDVNSLRTLVIEALFYCHQPLSNHLKSNFALEALLGKSCVSSWQLRDQQCTWIMCYKFQGHMRKPKHNPHHFEKQDRVEVVDDWESLANSDDDDDGGGYVVNSKKLKTEYTNEAASLLVIWCDRFIPFPSDYLNTNSSSALRLKAVRELLSTDMRSINLEMDLASLTGDQSITWKYKQIKKYKVLPWWHSDFRKFNK